VDPGLNCQCGASIASMVAEGGDAAAGCVLEELEVQEGAAALGEAGEDLFPAALGLVAVGKLHVRVFEGEAVFGEFFEANYDVGGGGGDPAAFWDEGCADSGEFLVVEDAERGAFDIDGVAGGKEGGGCCGCYSGGVSKVADLRRGGKGIRAERCSSALVSARRCRVVAMIEVFL
jgi:hypothetical protein